MSNNKDEVKLDFGNATIHKNDSQQPHTIVLRESEQSIGQPITQDQATQSARGAAEFYGMNKGQIDVFAQRSNGTFDHYPLNIRQPEQMHRPMAEMRVGEQVTHGIEQTQVDKHIAQKNEPQQQQEAKQQDFSQAQAPSIGEQLRQEHLKK